MTLGTDITAGLQHPIIPMEEVVIKPGALDELPRIAGENAGRITYLVDSTPFSDHADPNLKRTVADLLQSCGDVTQTVLDGPVHADEKTVQQAVEASEGTDVVVSFGSGTLTDIAKVAAATAHARHVVVQSAASVNGFADDESVLLVNGAKRTTPSGWPAAIIADTDVIASAPSTLNASGLGDMISMFTAPADWYLSSLFDLDHGWDPKAAVMTRKYGEELLRLGPGIGTGNTADVRTLTQFVTLSGMSMGIAGQTSPSSGMEHTISHMLDMAHGARREDTAYHGAQVGIATVIVSLLWRRMSARLAEGKLSEFTLMSDEEANARVQEVFGWMDPEGTTAAECWKDYSKKLTHLRNVGASNVLRGIQKNWNRHSALLAPLLTEPEGIVDALRSAGAALKFSEMNVPSDERDSVWAVSHCHLMRNRFNIADLAFATGYWGPQEVESVLNEAADLGVGV